MDYGTHLKKTHGNPNSRARNYTKQSTFKGSDRQVRGAIIRTLSEAAGTDSALKKRLSHLNEMTIDVQLDRLLREALISKTKQTYHLPS